MISRPKQFIIAAALTMFSTTAFAQERQPAGGLFVEPGVTYQQYNSSINYPSPFSNSSGKVEGFGLLGRFGIQINDIVFAAVDARFSKPKFKDSTNDLNTTANQYDVGPLVGIQTPVAGLKLWATWILQSELDPGESNGFDYKFKSGNGYRVGVGFHLAVVSLNLEYQKIKYGSTNIQKLGPISPSANTDSIKFDGDGWIASVSFPIGL